MIKEFPKSIAIIILILAGFFGYLYFTHAAYYLPSGSTDLRALYHLENASDSATYAAPGAFDLQPIGSVATTTGKFNLGYNVSSTGEILRAPGISTTTLKHSVHGWFNFSSFKNTGDNTVFLFDFGNSTCRVTLDGVNKSVGIYNGVSVATGNNVVTSTGSWYMIDVTDDGANTAKIYVNGVLEATSGGSGEGGVNCNDPGVNGFQIGNLYNNTTDYYARAVIDDVAVLGRDLSQAEITALWNNGAGQEVCSVIDCGNTVGFSYHLVYPTGNLVTPDFTNWVVSYANATSGIMTINFGLVSSTLDLSSSRSLTSDIASSGIISIYKPQPLWFVPLATTTQWWAQPTFQSYAGATSSGTLISFFVNNTALATSTSASTTQAAGPFVQFNQTETSSTAPCLPPGNILDVGGGLSYAICWGGNFLFQPHQIVQDALNNQVNTFKQTFPFGIPFTLYDQAVLAVNTASSTAEPTIAFVAPAFLPFSTSSRTIPLLSASSGNVLAPVKTDLYNYEDYIMILFAVGAIYLTVRHGRKNPS